MKLFGHPTPLLQEETVETNTDTTNKTAANFRYLILFEFYYFLDENNLLKIVCKDTFLNKTIQKKYFLA